MTKHWILYSACAISLLSFSVDPNPIVGRWEYKREFKSGPFHFIYIFRSDSSSDGILNGKSFTTGRYYTSSDTLHIADPICGGSYYASYRLKFYARDSVTLQMIADTCTGRRGLDGMTLIRTSSK